MQRRVTLSSGAWVLNCMAQQRKRLRYCGRRPLVPVRPGFVHLCGVSCIVFAVILLITNSEVANLWCRRSLWRLPPAPAPLLRSHPAPEPAPTQRRWDAIVSCLKETPCPALRKLPAAPPSYAAAEAHFLELYEASAGFRGLPYHSYAGYNGPWIENVVALAAQRNASAFFARFYPVVPLVVQQTDICVLHTRLIPALQNFVGQRLRSDYVYAIITQVRAAAVFVDGPSA